MAKKTVSVELVTAVVPIVAEVGDRLMIFNGVCVGVDTGKPQDQKRGKAEQPPDLPASREVRVRSSRADAAATRDRVYKMLAASPKPLNLTAIAKRYANTHHKEIDPSMMARAVLELRKQKLVVASGIRSRYFYSAVKATDQVAA